MAGTVFTPSLEGMKHVKSENGVMLTKPFLDVCKLILPVLGTLFSSFLFLPKTKNCNEVLGFYIVLIQKRGLSLLLIIMLSWIIIALIPNVSMCCHIWVCVHNNTLQDISWIFGSSVVYVECSWYLVLICAWFLYLCC